MSISSLLYGDKPCNRLPLFRNDNFFITAFDMVYEFKTFHFKFFSSNSNHKRFSFLFLVSESLSCAE